jgi:hypothetical protein
MYILVIRDLFRTGFEYFLDDSHQQKLAGDDNYSCYCYY